MDREKVIKGLETCIPMKYETNEEKECRHEQCPYGRENYKPMNGCFWDLMEDALALLKEQEAVKPDYKKYIPIEWLQKYATLCCTFDMNKTAIHFVDTWFKMHEMCCCEKKEHETNGQK